MNLGLVDHAAPRTLPDRYEVSAVTFRFGGLALPAAETPAETCQRPAGNLRRDGKWSGQLVRHTLGHPCDAAPAPSGSPHLHPPREELPSTLVSEVTGCQVLDTPSGLLLRDYLLLLADQLPRMTIADGQRLAEATRAMIALAAAECPARQEAAAAPLGAVQLAQVHSFIRANLGSARLGPMRICQVAGIARSQLYRLFEPYGGVALFIQRERLNAAYRALTDPNDTRSIGEIAEASGLFDASSFSRMFRRAFGIPPRELRMAQRMRTLSARETQAI